MALLSIELIAHIKRQLKARGTNLSGNCGAFEITKRVAWAARETGIGLRYKPAGAGCEGFAAGFLVYDDTSGVDILVDAGGSNMPSLQYYPPDEHLRETWRAPIDPGDTDDQGNVGRPTPVPGDNGLEERLERRITDLEARTLGLVASISGQISSINKLQQEFLTRLVAAEFAIENPKPWPPGYVQVGRLGSYLIVRRLKNGT